MKNFSLNSLFFTCHYFRHLLLSLSKIQKIYTFKLLFVVVLSWHQPGETRPEYGLKHGINRCTACHISPAGGGIKNLNGKLYGAHGFKPPSHLRQDFLSADIRFGYLQPKKKENRSGLFVMAGLVGGQITLTEKESPYELKAVLSHDILNSAEWDAFVRIQYYDDTETSWKPQHFLFGRYHLPFGLLNDEHRTYTKLQTLSQYNSSLEMGALFSGQPYESLHYDVSFINGESSKGRLNPGQAPLWGTSSNLRWMPQSPRTPFFLGGSLKNYKKEDGLSQPWAHSVYGGFSFERATQGLMRADILFEVAGSQHLNQSFQANAGFPLDTNYLNLISNTESKGYFTQFNYYLTPKVTLQFKFDRIELNKDFPADGFEKLGIGLKHVLPGSGLFYLRFEKAQIGQPNEKENPSSLADDALWALYQISI